MCFSWLAMSSEYDASIAATAVHRRLTLLTHDRDLKDLPVSGLTVVSFA
jgi:predicted nucleic acid-binding protein